MRAGPHRPIAVLRAPSALGLAPCDGRVPGVGRAPEVLVANGLLDRLGAVDSGEILPLPYSFGVDPRTGVRNARAVRDYAERLGTSVADVVGTGALALVLGGDCSILLGTMRGLRQQGDVGLVFIDGHRDFQTPQTSATGGVAGMDLAFATGRGPEILTRFAEDGPLVRDEAVIALAYRDEAVGEVDGSQGIEETAIRRHGLDAVREMGVGEAARRALSVVGSCAGGFWVHLDVDVLTTDAMPAVDSPQPGGLTVEELEALLVPVLRHPSALGLDVAIYDPDRDPDGAAGRRLTNLLVDVLTASGREAVG